MKPINGNLSAVVEINTATEKNEIGELVRSFTGIQTLTGFLDYMSGTTGYTNYDAKIEESTHIFVADYVVLDSRIKAENSRLSVDGKHYDIILIDDPMELHRHLEIYLKYTGD